MNYKCWIFHIELLVLRVSSLVRFYKSRFWFFSEFFLKNFWIKFLKYFWKISESRDFLLPTIQKWRKLAVLPLFSNFLRCFSRILTNFRIFSEFFQKFLKIFWKISEIFLKNYESRNFLLPTIQKWRTLAVLLLFSSCFAAIFILFALLFSNFDEFQKFVRIFSENFQKFFRNFWKFSEKFLKNLWIQRFSAASHSKMNETSCFAAVFKLFCCYFQTFCVTFLEFWRISEFFQKIFRNFSDFFQKFLKIFWKFSEIFLKIFWKFSEIFLKNLWIQRFSAASDSKMNEN